MDRSSVELTAGKEEGEKFSGEVFSGMVVADDAFKVRSFSEGNRVTFVMTINKRAVQRDYGFCQARTI